MSDLSRKITKVINECSVEKESNTPDFVLAKYLLLCLQAFEEGVEERDDWHGNASKPK